MACTHRQTAAAARASALLGLTLLLCAPASLSAAPDDGTDPARARVAAQCAAFWEGAGEPARAAPFRQIAGAAGAARAETEQRIERLRTAMARLAADRATSPRAQQLWDRHAALCSE